MTLMSVIVAFLFAISLWYLSSNHKVTFVKLKATDLKFLPNRSWHRLIPAGGTFVSAKGGTFQSDTPGTFVSAMRGTIDSAVPGTFESDTGGTFNPLLSKYERMGKIQRLIDSIVTTSWDSDYADYKYLFDTKEIRVFEFYSRTTRKETRAQYIVDNFVKYFNEDLSQYKRTDMVISSREEHGVTFDEMHSLCAAIYPRTGLILDKEEHPAHPAPLRPRYHVHFATDPDLGEDLHVQLICSR